MPDRINRINLCESFTHDIDCALMLEIKETPGETDLGLV